MTGRIGTLCIAATLALGGCASSSGSGGAAAAAGATSLATRSPIDEAIDQIVSILPFTEEASPAAQRERMVEAAGTEQFRHEELAAGRVEMARHRATFEEQRSGFVSTQFAESRDRFRTGRSRPVAGPVLGTSITETLKDPAAAQAILAGVAASKGVAVAGVQPILAQLLPGFGF